MGLDVCRMKMASQSVTNLRISSIRIMEYGTASKWHYFKDKIMQKTTLNRVEEEEKAEEVRALNSSRIEDGANLSPLHVAAIMGNKTKMGALLREHKSDINKGDKIGRTPLIYSILGDRYECAEALLKAGANVNKTDVDERTALHWASYQGNQKFVKLLLDKGALQGMQDKEGQTPLHLSLSHDNIKVMARLLKDADIDCSDSNGMTALHFSVAYERVEHTKMLLHAKASPDCQDNDKKTVLHWAKTNKETTIVSKLLDYERVMLILNSKDSEGRTALHLYVAVDNRKLVRYLTSREDCLLSEQDHMQRTPLHLAAILGHTDIAEVLLSRGCDALKPDNNGVRPLHYAAQNNFGKTLGAMLMHDNVKDMPDNDGRTALMWAAAKGARDALIVLINHKQDFLASDRSGATALHMASEGGHLQCVNLLLQHQAGVNVMDKQQYTPLFSACQMGHRDVVETLLLHGAAVDLEDKEGRTPLHWAAVGGITDICAMLISNGLDVAKRDKLGRPALHYAAYGGFYSCMSLLLESGADVDARDNTGVTALHWACASGSLDAVKLLVRHNAFFNYVETEGDKLTPLDYAIFRDHQDVAQFMIEHGAFTIAAIQDEAALVIQKTWRGYRLRKIFEEQKRLFILHEKMRKGTKMKQDENGQPKAVNDVVYKQPSISDEEKFAEIFGKSFCQFDDAPNAIASSEIQVLDRQPLSDVDFSVHQHYLADNEPAMKYSSIYGVEAESRVRNESKDRSGIQNEEEENETVKYSDHGKTKTHRYNNHETMVDKTRLDGLQRKETNAQVHSKMVDRGGDLSGGFTGKSNKEILKNDIGLLPHNQNRNKDFESGDRGKLICDRLVIENGTEGVPTGVSETAVLGTDKKEKSNKLSKNRSIPFSNNVDRNVVERTTRLFNALPTPSTSSSSLYSYASDADLKPWQVYRRERHRKHLIRRKIESAIVIQRAFRSHITKQRSNGVECDETEGTQDGIVQDDAKNEERSERDVQMMEDIAALVIQLHWRKFLKTKLLRQKNVEKKNVDLSDSRLLACRDRRRGVSLHQKSQDPPREAARKKSSAKHRKRPSEQGTYRFQSERTELPNINSSTHRIDDIERKSRDPGGSNNRRGSRIGQKAPAVHKTSRHSTTSSKGDQDGTTISTFKIHMPQNWSSNLQKFPLRY